MRFSPMLQRGVLGAIDRGEALAILKPAARRGKWDAFRGQAKVHQWGWGGLGVGLGSGVGEVGWMELRIIFWATKMDRQKGTSQSQNVGLQVRPAQKPCPLVISDGKKILRIAQSAIKPLQPKSPVSWKKAATLLLFFWVSLGPCFWPLLVSCMLPIGFQFWLHLVNHFRTSGRTRENVTVYLTRKGNSVGISPKT